MEPGRFEREKLKQRRETDLKFLKFPNPQILFLFFFFDLRDMAVIYTGAGKGDKYGPFVVLQNGWGPPEFLTV